MNQDTIDILKRLSQLRGLAEDMLEGNHVCACNQAETRIKLMTLVLEIEKFYKQVLER